jgi:hypothetical protein
MSLKRKLAAVCLGAFLSSAVVSPAFAAEHHPPKFGVHQTQCSSDANQPNCPGSH